MSANATDTSSLSAADIDENYKSIILNDVQGDIVLGFSKEKELFWFCKIRDPEKFKEGLAKIDITNGQAVLDKKAEIAKCPKGTLVKAPFLNVAFSSKGLEALGLPSDLGEDRRALEENEKEFGGHGEFRFKSGQRAGAKSLGDRGLNKAGEAFDPDWESAFKGDIDVLFLVAAESWSTVKEKQKEVQDCMGASIQDIYSFKGAVRPRPHRGHEHFGWLDDISNPGIKGIGIDGQGTFLPGQMQLKPGVLLCGMEGDRVRAGRPPWAKCGSFLAFRQLEQKVPEFHKFLSETSAAIFKDPSPEGAHKLGAHLVGRWKSGAPLQITPERDDEKLGQDKFRNNKFTFPQNRGDMGQALCPYSAHIRKTNPRADLSQFEGAVEERAIRRAGITYGPELTASEIRDQVSEFERGLAFVCYQSDLARGFEFMQLAWANNPNFIFGKGLQSNDPGFKANLPPFQVGFDPLIGQSGDSNGHKRDTWGSDDGPKIRGMPEFLIMDEGNPLTALAATGSVASRFVTQSEIDSAKERREADWKAAYARLGQDPPPKPTEDPEYDGRSLYERLQANKIAKQEQWEEQSKLSNQFRALEEDEIHFLDSLVDEKIVKEQKRKEEENEELKHYRDAVNQRASQQSAAPTPPTSTAKPAPTKSTAPAKAQPKKNQKALLKGAIVRKSGAASSSAASPSTSTATAAKTTDTAKSPVTTATPASKPSESATPSSPQAKNGSTAGQKRSESSTSEPTDELSEDAQSVKRQKV